MASVFPPSSKARTHRLIAAGNLVSCTLLSFGILGALITRLETTETLVVFTVHPVTSLVWLAMGIVGVAMSTGGRWAERYLAACGAVLVLWGLLCLALDGSPSEVFARDAPLVALLLGTGAFALAAALVPPVARVGALG